MYLRKVVIDAFTGKLSLFDREKYSLTKSYTLGYCRVIVTMHLIKEVISKERDWSVRQKMRGGG